MSVPMDNRRFRLVHDEENSGWTAYDGDAVLFTAREHYGADETIRLFVGCVGDRLTDDESVILLDVTEYGYDAIIVDPAVMGS